jgi:hypothetical protein
MPSDLYSNSGGISSGLLAPGSRSAKKDHSPARDSLKGSSLVADRMVGRAKLIKILILFLYKYYG